MGYNKSKTYTPEKLKYYFGIFLEMNNRGLTQAQMSKELGISQAALSYGIRSALVDYYDKYYNLRKNNTSRETIFRKFHLTHRDHLAILEMLFPDKFKKKK